MEKTSLPQDAGFARLKELYDAGVSTHRIAEDPDICRAYLTEVPPGAPRRWRIYRLLSSFVHSGVLAARPGFHSNTTRKVEPQPPVESHESRWEEHLLQFERLIGARERRAADTDPKTGDGYEAIVISDLHIPDENPSLLVEIATKNEGKDLYIVGDINHFDGYSRHMKREPNPPLKELLARTDAVFDFLSDYHPNIYLLLGNHDFNLPNNPSKLLGADYYWLCREFLIWAYERRHGVKVLSTELQKPGGAQATAFSFYQVGDCVLSHALCAGRRPSAGVEKVHRHLQELYLHFGLPKFNVILHAHTHQTSYFRHGETNIHCYEIGAMCTIGDYVLHEPRYSPPQHGWFHLVQDQDGITDINRSRLYVV